MKIDKLKNVLDTNIVLAAISAGSPYRKIIDSFLNSKYDLYVDYEILLEYEEMLSDIFNRSISNSFMELILHRPNLYKIRSWFQLNLITINPDDNKFVDCAFACNAYFIITNDKHFRMLKQINFPKLNVLE